MKKKSVPQKRIIHFVILINIYQLYFLIIVICDKANPSGPVDKKSQTQNKIPNLTSLSTPQVILKKYRDSIGIAPRLAQQM